MLPGTASPAKVAPVLLPLNTMVDQSARGSAVTSPQKSLTGPPPTAGEPETEVAVSDRPKQKAAKRGMGRVIPSIGSKEVRRGGYKDRYRCPFRMLQGRHFVHDPGSQSGIEALWTDRDIGQAVSTRGHSMHGSARKEEGPLGSPSDHSRGRMHELVLRGATPASRNGRPHARLAGCRCLAKGILQWK